MSAHRSAGRRGGGPRGVAQHLSAQAALVWLLLALVLVPTLGRLHQVVHGDSLDRVHAGPARLAPALHSLHTPRQTDAAAAAAAAASAPARGHGVFDRLLGTHTAADCQLLDQLALGHALHAVGVVLPPLVPALAPHLHRADATGAWAVTQFQARGPPRA